MSMVKGLDSNEAGTASHEVSGRNGHHFLPAPSHRGGSVANGHAAIEEGAVTEEDHSDREALVEVPLNPRSSGTAAAGKKPPRRGYKASQESREERRRSGDHRGSSGSFVFAPLRKAFQRLSHENLLIRTDDPEDYNRIILEADTQSPVFYYNNSSNPGSSLRNDSFVLVLLLILFCPLGGVVPLVLLLMAFLEKDERKKRKLHSRAVRLGKFVILLSIAVAIVAVIVAIAVLAYFLSPREALQDVDANS